MADQTNTFHATLQIIREMQRKYATIMLLASTEVAPPDEETQRRFTQAAIDVRPAAFCMFRLQFNRYVMLGGEHSLVNWRGMAGTILAQAMDASLRQVVPDIMARAAGIRLLWSGAIDDTILTKPLPPESFLVFNEEANCWISEAQAMTTRPMVAYRGDTIPGLRFCTN